MKIFTFIAFFLFTLNVQAQEPDNFRRIESARIALITERLELTPEQAEKFWPLYREYVAKRQELRREYLNSRRDVNRSQMTEEDSKKLLAKGLELKEKQLELDKVYGDRLGNVITAKQLVQLRKAEDDFRQMLMDRLERRLDARDRNQRRQEPRSNE